MIDLHANYRNSVEGRLLETARTMQVINPATEEVFASVPDAGAGDLDVAVAAAQRAFPAWRDTPLAERQRLVAKLGDAIEAHAEDFMRLLTREQGKARAGAGLLVGDVQAFVEHAGLLAIALRRSHARARALRHRLPGLPAYAAMRPAR